MVSNFFLVSLRTLTKNSNFAEQDQRIDELSNSINRQHHISLQINDELDTHHGLLQELDTDLDRTESRLRKARRKLDTLARGVKGNSMPYPVMLSGGLTDWCLGSVIIIGVLIIILLILIIRFKT